MKRLLIIAGSVVTVIYLLLWWAITSSDALRDWSERGQFGSMFGAVSAWFSGLAFAGIIVSIYYQNEELKQQREELTLTREELKGQREQLEGQKRQLERQNETLQQQQFEATFFQLVRLQNQATASIRVSTGSPAPGREFVTGREAFKELYADFKNTLAWIRSKEKGENYAEERLVQIAYAHFHEKHRAQLSYYFQTLFILLDTADKGEETGGAKYVNVARTQLSEYELQILFYHCASSRGWEDFRPLVEKHMLFLNLSPWLLANEHHFSFFPLHAYKPRVDA